MGARGPGHRRGLLRHGSRGLRDRSGRAGLFAVFHVTGHGRGADDDLCAALGDRRALEWLGVHPERLRGRGWALGAGVVAGVLGGAVGTPGPPVVLYAAAQGWSPRTIKANLQIFFIVNEAVILAGYWWAGLLTRDVWRFTAIFFVPAALGLIAGMALFARVDQRRFRQIVFALLFASGAVLLLRG